jgi:hypothetical protein
MVFSLAVELLMVPKSYYEMERLAGDLAGMSLSRPSTD